MTRRIASWWTAFTRRPWEALTAAAMMASGVVDVFGALPFPPEAAVAAPWALWRVYGLWLALGSGMVLAAILHRCAPWARRAERAGMLLIAGAVAAAAAVYGHWLLLGHLRPAPDDPTAVAIVRYLLALMLATAVGSLARWRFLGTVPPAPRAPGRGCD